MAILAASDECTHETFLQQDEQRHRLESGPRLSRSCEEGDVGAELKRWIEGDITPGWILDQERMSKMSDSRRLEEVGNIRVTVHLQCILIVQSIVSR